MGSAARIANYVTTGVAQLIGMYSKPRGATVALAPVILGITPNTGPAAGLTLVRIYGYNFDGVSSVTIGGSPATGLIVGGGIITCYTPIGTGSANVVVVGPGGTTTLVGGFIYPGGVVAPTLSAINYALGDTLGGGSSIVVTGTGLLSATALTIGGTSCTIAGTTATTVTATLPARAAGSALDVVVTTPGGTATLGGAFEYWNPGSATGVTLFLEKPNYSVAAGTGTWTARVGSSVSRNPAPPDDGTGAPNFDGSAYLQATGTSLLSLMSASAGTAACVVKPTSARAAYAGGSPYDCPNVFSNATNGTAGLWFATIGGVDKVGAHVYDGVSYKETSTPCVLGSYHALMMRFSSATTVDVGIDGAATVSSAALAGAWASNTGDLRLGTNWDATLANSLRGIMRAIVFSSSTLDNTFWSKFYKWSQQRHGVA